MTLTTTNINIGIEIRNIENPEWGTFKVVDVYDLGIYTIKNARGERVLFDTEFNEWEIIN
jgi:hypothetical protein